MQKKLKADIQKAYSFQRAFYKIKAKETKSNFILKYNHKNNKLLNKKIIIPMSGL